MEITDITIKEDFHCGKCYLFSFSYHKITLFEKKYVIKFTLISMYHLRSFQPFVTKLAKSHISAQFSIRMFVLGWYTYFETVEVLPSLCFREKGVKTLKIYE